VTNVLKPFKFNTTTPVTVSTVSFWCKTWRFGLEERTEWIWEKVWEKYLEFREKCDKFLDKIPW
jgi:hypothetical protein